MTASSPTHQQTSQQQVDQELVQRVQRGDMAAFDLLVRKYQHRIAALIGRYIRDWSECQDVAQETFIRAYRAMANFRGDAQFSTWLHRIIVNSSLDRLRRLKPTQEWPEYDIADTRDAHAQTDVRLDVRQALAQLPEGQRLCLVLVDMEGLSVTEAATHLGIAEGTVKSRCARGRTALAGMLADR